jgi:hypothetical protein
MGSMVVTGEMLAAKFAAIFPHLDERQRRSADPHPLAAITSAQRQKPRRARCVETCTAGSASGLEKRTSGNADTALQADSTNHHRHQRTPADGASQVKQSKDGGRRPRALASGRRDRLHCLDLVQCTWFTTTHSRPGY